MDRSSVDADFEPFAHAMWPRLVRAGVAWGYGLEEAQDLAQTALLACWRRWKKAGPVVESPAAYAYKVLRNRANRFALTARRELTLPIPDVLSGVPDRDDAISIMQAIGELSPEHRELIFCRYYLQLTLIEIAEVTRVPHGTVKSRHARALQQLRTKFEGAEWTPRLS